MNAFTRFYKSHLPPQITYALVSVQMSLFPSHFYRRQRTLIRTAHLDRVKQGPFAGTRYSRFAADKMLLPRLLGTYECEVYPAVEDLIAREPDVVVNVGAGEGYFSVGLARRLPSVPIFAYDANRWARYLLLETRRRNGLNDRPVIAGFCDPKTLHRHLSEATRPAVVCDVEGYETQLLDPQIVPPLVRTVLLVEVHDHIRPGISDELRERFNASHTIQQFDSRSRSANDLPAGIDWDEETADFALDESKFRFFDQSWLYFTPR